MDIREDTSKKALEKKLESLNKVLSELKEPKKHDNLYKFPKLLYSKSAKNPNQRQNEIHKDPAKVHQINQNKYKFTKNEGQNSTNSTNFMKLNKKSPYIKQFSSNVRINEKNPSGTPYNKVLTNRKQFSSNDRFYTKKLSNVSPYKKVSSNMEQYSWNARLDQKKLNNSQIKKHSEIKKTNMTNKWKNENKSNNKFKYVKQNVSLPTDDRHKINKFHPVNQRSSHMLRDLNYKKNVNTSKNRIETFSTEKKTALNILSKYKVVKKNTHSAPPKHLLKVNKMNNKNGKYLFVRNQNYTSSKSARAYNIVPRYPKINKDTFIRRRYKIVQRRKPSMNSIRLKGNDRRKSWERKINSMDINSNSFASRRLLYQRKRYSLLRNLPKKVYTQGSATIKPKYNPSRMLSPRKQLVLSRHGSDFYVSKNFKSLRKCNSKQSHPKFLPGSSRSISKYKVRNTNVKVLKQQISSSNISAKTLVARKVIRKNLAYVYKKKRTEIKYCVFYCRFGKCKRGKNCKYIHDPQKVAVCTRFLRGTCKDENCLFSHKIDPNKMPVCLYFLKGDCVKDNCPYRHVNVNQNADVCTEFLNGYCSKGGQCTLKHVLECEEYLAKGRCSKGNSCKLLHVKRKKIGVNKRKSVESRQPRAFKAKRRKIIPKISVDVGNATPSPLKDKGSLIPKFISDKMANESDNNRPTSYSSIRNLFGNQDDSPNKISISNIHNKADNDVEMSSSSKQSDFIPLICSSLDNNKKHSMKNMNSSSLSDDSDEEKSSVRQDRRFSFKDQDFISL